MKIVNTYIVLEITMYYRAYRKIHETENGKFFSEDSNGHLHHIEKEHFEEFKKNMQ